MKGTPTRSASRVAYVRLALGCGAGLGLSLAVACLDVSSLQSSDPPPADDGGTTPPSDATTAADTSTTPPDGAVKPDAQGADAGGGDAGAAWILYTNIDSYPNQWTQVPLDVAWNGPNAPPPRGILAVTQLTLFDRLLVWTNEGKYYVREGNTWLPPEPTSQRFPALAGRDFRGAYHQPGYPAATTEELTFTDAPTAILYNVNDAGAAAFETQVTMTDEPGPYGAPKGTKKLRWVTRSWNPLKKDGGALAEYSAYENDDYVYFFDATALPTNKWLFLDAPLFKGKTGVPPKEKIRSGWRHDTAEATNLIVQPD